MNLLVNILTAIGAGVIFAALAFSSFDFYGRFRRASYRRQIEYGAVTMILVAVISALVMA